MEEGFLGLKDLRLNPDVITSDVAEFESALAERELTRAASCYGRAFLPGFLRRRYGETLEHH